MAIREIDLLRMPEPTWSWLRVNDDKLFYEEREGLKKLDETKGSNKEGCHSSEIDLKSLETDEEEEFDDFVQWLTKLYEKNVTVGTVSEKVKIFGSEEEVTAVLLDLIVPAYAKDVFIDISSDKIFANFDGIRLNLLKGSNGIMKIRSREASENSAFMTILNLRDDSNLTLIDAQFNEKGTKSFKQLQADLGNGSKLIYFGAELGSSEKKDSYNISLRGDESSVDFRMIYTAVEDESLDFTSYIEHLGKKTEATLVARGVLDGNAKKIFRDTLDFKKGSSQSKGREEEYVLMLSPKVKNVSVPLLYCGEDDVEGEHAASSARPEDSALYYLMSRGISETEARKLLAKSSFSALLADLPDENIREEILSFVDGILE